MPPQSPHLDPPGLGEQQLMLSGDVESNPGPQNRELRPHKVNP